MPPALVTEKNENEIFRRMYPLEKFNLRKPVFKVSDRVRVSQKKETFGNKYNQNWTTEIFYVDKIRYTDPITYSIRALNLSLIHI